MEILLEILIKGVFGNLLKLIADGVYEVYYLVFIRDRMVRLLRRYSRYYNGLGGEKNTFERKTWEFVRLNEFVPRNDLKLTLTIKTIIAAHAVQLSMYLTEEAYDHYEKIIIYKDYYLSRLTNQYHKAEVNPSFRAIVFSVRAVYESLQQNSEGRNVLLHEFAHALWLEHKLVGHLYRVFNDSAFDEVERLITFEYERSEEEGPHFFRQYAFSSKAEFFAVAVENFFERAESFQSTLPVLYMSLTRLFQQNPLRVKTHPQG